MDIRDRYLRDPLIHAMVNYMRKVIRELQLTPTEVRECAMLACVLEEQNTVRIQIPGPHKGGEGE